MASTGTHESHPQCENQFELENFNVCRLVADKAMHDLDYKARLERSSAHAHSNAIELAELDMEIEKGMTAMRPRGGVPLGRI